MPFLLLLACTMAKETSAPSPLATAVVTARGETAAVQTRNADAADDPAIWQNINDPSASLIVGTDIGRLEGVERAWLPSRHIAKSAGPCANRAHDHHGGVLLGPAFPDIWAGRLLAHRAEIVFADDLERLVVGGRGRLSNRIQT
jgi:hypothetical protein